MQTQIHNPVYRLSIQVTEGAMEHPKKKKYFLLPKRMNRKLWKKNREEIQSQNKTIYYYELQTSNKGLPKAFSSDTEGGIFSFAIMLNFTRVPFGVFLRFTLRDSESRPKGGLGVSGK